MNEKDIIKETDRYRIVKDKLNGKKDIYTVWLRSQRFNPATNRYMDYGWAPSTSYFFTVEEAEKYANKYEENLEMSENYYINYKFKSDLAKEAWMMNEVISSMNNEDAYYSSGWLYEWEDEMSPEDCDDWFSEEENFNSLKDTFEEIYKEYHDDDLYNASQETIDYAHKVDKKLGLKPISNIEYESLKEDFQTSVDWFAVTNELFEIFGDEAEIYIVDGSESYDVGSKQSSCKIDFVTDNGEHQYLLKGNQYKVRVIDKGRELGSASNSKELAELLLSLDNKQESLKEDLMYTKEELYAALKDAYGFTKEEANDWIKSANKELKDEIIKGFRDQAKKNFYEEDFDDEEELKYELVKRKSVRDSSGFWTEYSWYKDSDGHHVFIFGDSDLYRPGEDSPDWECETEEEAQEWFDSYEGFEEDEFEADDYIESCDIKEDYTKEREELAKKLKKELDANGVNLNSLYVDNPSEEKMFIVYAEVDGDWKHDHARATSVIQKVAEADGYEVVFKEEDVLKEDGSDNYLSMHSYGLTDKKDAELKEDSLHPKFKKDIKNQYKQWDRNRDYWKKSIDNRIKNAKEMNKEFGNKYSDKEVEDRVKDLFDDEVKKSNKPFKLNKTSYNIERKDFPYYITFYKGTSYYHPEEGGYYIAGLSAYSSQGYKTFDEATKSLEDWLKQNTSANIEFNPNLPIDDDNYSYDKDEVDYEVIKDNDGNVIGAVASGKYIGQEEEIWVESKKDYLSRELGDQMYEALKESNGAMKFPTQEEAKEYAKENGLKIEKEQDCKDYWLVWFNRKTESLKESFDDMMVYMNTWKNYNEYGADLSQYGIKDGWMSIEDALDFAETYAEDEPFINDYEGTPMKISEYDNAVSVLETLQEIQDSNVDEEVVSAVVHAGYDIEDALEIAENGEYFFFSGVDNESDLAYAYIDSIGSLSDALGDRVTNYIDEDQMRRDYEWDVRDIVERDARSQIEDEHEDEEDFDIESAVEEFVDEHFDDYMDDIIREEIESAERGETDLSTYFDYEAFGRDLTFDGWEFVDEGAILVER